MRQLNYQIPSISNTHLASISSTPDPLGAQKYESVTISGSIAGISCGVTSGTLTLYDISSPASPILLTTINAGGAYDCAIQGQYIYWGGSGSTFVYNAKILGASTVVTGTLNLTATAGAPYSVAPYGNYLYVATQNKGLTVVNITNPSSMLQVFQEGGTTNKSYGVCIGPANTVYTTNYDTAGTHVRKYLKTWDISTPSAPTLTNTYTFAANAKCNAVQYFNGYCYVTDTQNNTVMVVDMSNPSAPNQIATLAMSGLANANSGIAICTSVPGKVYGYIGSGSNATLGAAIDFWDITSPASPTLISTTWSGVANSVGGPCSIATLNSGTYVVVANYGVAPGIGSMDIHSSPTVYEPIAINATNLISTSLALNVTDTSTLAKVSLQASNDATNPSNYSDIVVNMVTNQNGLIFIPKIDLSYEYLRLAYSTLGNGTASGTLKALGV